MSLVDLQLWPHLPDDHHKYHEVNLFKFPPSIYRPHNTLLFQSTQQFAISGFTNFILYIFQRLWRHSAGEAYNNLSLFTCRHKHKELAIKEIWTGVFTIHQWALLLESNQHLKQQTIVLNQQQPVFSKTICTACHLYLKVQKIFGNTFMVHASVSEALNTGLRVQRVSDLMGFKSGFKSPKHRTNHLELTTKAWFSFFWWENGKVFEYKILSTDILLSFLPNE